MLLIVGKTRDALEYATLLLAAATVWLWLL
jgi:hypothetical protein